LQRNATLIQFKLEVKRKNLPKEALKSLRGNRSDFVVANALEDLRVKYKSFILDKRKNITAINSKMNLFEKLKDIADGGGNK
jgi:uncharacterized protein (DUF1778 family)